MGIPGLTSFINNRSDRYLEYYELYDTYLVIDGNSICCQIYSWQSKCNCAFGGDYDIFAKSVSDFFDDLLKCNITPLVLIDGGIEDKKLKTIIRRAKEKIHIASSFCPIYQQNMKIFPLLTKEVFKEVLREKNIKHVQCLFEADSAIAAVARALNCPMLSYDSDFYIYGASYIPFDRFNSDIVKRPNRDGYMKRCKIYKVEHLLNSYKGLNQSMLPLAAILLGNDYVRPGTFKNFFRHLKLCGATKKKYNQQLYRIDAIFTWLSKYTLDNAIIRILSTIPKPARQKLLKIIETNINDYTNASIEILILLGFSKDHVVHSSTHSMTKTFKFDGDMDGITYIKETCEEEDIESSENEEDDEIEVADTFRDLEFTSNNIFINNLPGWFVNEFLMAKYPSYFMDLLVRQLYICPIQVEDYSYPSSIILSLKIIRVIFGLLKSGINSRVNSLTYMIRDENKQLKSYELKTLDDRFHCKLPSLFTLREIPLIIRKQIFDNTLQCSNQCINELPPDWVLYIICIKYWIKQQQLHEWRRCYLYSVLICMLLNIIHSKIGKHRNIQYFQSKYNYVIANIQKNRKTNDYKPQYSMNSTLFEALKEVNRDDCIMAAPFFLSHVEMDQKLCANSKKFNRTIVHVFAEFQNCLRHSMNLNTLLGNPYPQIKIANLFNGTFLYNLCNNLKTRHNIEAYINTVFQNSPSLLRLLNILLLKVAPLFGSVFEDNINSQRKSRRRCKSRKPDQETESNTENVSADDNLQKSQFFDPNNRYTLLNCMQ
ncbi:single-strand DNA endonuclease protein asteroid [Calliopsis andreniformis]|uniref:single-strand DNA endonuclease protein asteroid n=1 Tax=Calliopsis andreniformis TaxID=337506 RepID=UPI003FCE49B9